MEVEVDCNFPVAAIHSQMIWSVLGRRARDLTSPRTRLRIWVVRLPGFVGACFSYGPSPLLENTVDGKLLQDGETREIKFWYSKMRLLSDTR